MITNSNIELMGVSITNITSRELNKKILSFCNSALKAIITNVNIHAMNIAYKDSGFKELLNSASINFCDGDGVRLGASLFGIKIKEKITYNRWIWELASFSEKHNLTWFIVGSTKEVIERANHELKRRSPKLNILGYNHGYIRDKELNRKLIEEIKEKKPNILIVGMGMPIQEKWLRENYNDLDFNVALTAGAAFEYVSGAAKMTPEIFYKLKMEWFYRFLNDPKRLFKRYFIGNPLFILRIIKARLAS